MKLKPFLYVFCTLSFSLHASNYQQIEGEQDPGYQSPLTHAVEMQKTNARNQATALLWKIYQDKSIKLRIKSEYPALQNTQLLEFTHKEKESEMDKQVPKLLQLKFPQDAPQSELMKETETLKTDFFKEINHRLNHSLCDCCFYANPYEYWDASTSKRVTKWVYAEPYDCCPKFCLRCR